MNKNNRLRIFLLFLILFIDNKYFVDYVCLVKMMRCWFCFFLGILMNVNFILVYKDVKKYLFNI